MILLSGTCSFPRAEDDREDLVGIGGDDVLRNDALCGLLRRTRSLKVLSAGFQQQGRFEDVDATAQQHRNLQQVQRVGQALNDNRTVCFFATGGLLSRCALHAAQNPPRDAYLRLPGV